MDFRQLHQHHLALSQTGGEVFCGKARVFTAGRVLSFLVMKGDGARQLFFSSMGRDLGPYDTSWLPAVLD